MAMYRVLFMVALIVSAPAGLTGCLEPPDSPLQRVSISVDMPREQLEKAVETATGKRSSYNIFSMYDQTETTYSDGVSVLSVTFKRGYPHGMGLPGQDSIPAIDATVLSWTLSKQ